MAASRKSKIYFFFEKRVNLVNRRGLKEFLENIFKEEGRELKSLNYIFCSDEYLRVINKDYLNHDYYTDIISFELSKKKEPLEGEIYISVDRVKENSKMYKTPIEQELHRVVFHGVLHFCKYDDKLPTQRTRMKGREDKLISAYFNVPRGTVSQ